MGDDLSILRLRTPAPLRHRRPDPLLSLLALRVRAHEFQTIERIYHPDAAPLARDILKSRVAFHGEIRGILEAEE